MAEGVEREALIAQFSIITTAPADQAEQFLTASRWDLETAVASYFVAKEANADDPNDSDYVEDDDEPAVRPESSTSGGRILGEGPVEGQPGLVITKAESSQAKSKSTSSNQKKIATLGDYNSGNGDADELDDDDKQDFFAGGEKSGLAVQNPEDLKKKILEKAQKRGPLPKDPTPKKTHFSGAARTLGGDEAPSREVQVSPQSRQRPERVERVLHFWEDGFSIGDGDLYHIDDPRNADTLNLIRQGRAPLSIMDVEPGQEVDVEIKQHDEKYVKPKKKYKPFEGQGTRLGEPAPAVSSSMPGSFTTDTSSTTGSSATGPPTTNVDESQPTVTLRITTGTGTRMTSHFNTTQTIGDVYDFVRRAESSGRDFILQTTFPTTELSDKAKSLGDMPEFKRGGAVVQKYV